MNANLEDYDGVVDRIAEDFATPDVSGVYQIVEKRHRQRRHVQQGTAVFALILVFAGAALWVNRPQVSEVATEPPAAEDVIVTTTTTIEETAVASSPNELRDLLLATRSWTPIARTGIPETGSYAEHVRFFRSSGVDSVSLQSCLIVPPYTIDWEPDGFTVTGVDLEAELDARGCDEPGQEGIALAPVQTGEKVTITPNNDGTYELTGIDWSLTISAAEAPTQPTTTEAANTTTTTTIEETD